jgi:hypothetical protein
MSCAQPLVDDVIEGHKPLVVGQQFELALGESARIGDTEWVLSFDSVGEDSRCPRETACVWEGNARLQFTLREYSNRGGDAVVRNMVEVLDEHITLNTSRRFEYQKKIPVGTLVLQKLGPDKPLASHSKYAATLMIETLE